MDDERLNMRVNRIEEQLSNTLKAIDKLTADIDALKNYAVENNKVVNGILRKLDDQGERMDKVLLRMEKEENSRKAELQDERKQRQAELEGEKKARQSELQDEKRQRKIELENESMQRLSALENERRQRQAELENEGKQRQNELDAQNERFVNALNEDFKLRRQEMAIMNRRLELLERKV